MTEKLLQFIWQFQYFRKTGLQTATGECIHIIYQGLINFNQGPDFLNAIIKIGNTTWAGNIELHIHTSDWKKHRHEGDLHYKNVILHVVWIDDSAERNVSPNLQVISLFELQNHVSKMLLQRYELLMNTASFIPCEKMIHLVREINWSGWKERLLAERLLRKASAVELAVKQTNNHWEQTFWCLLSRNFGMTVNGPAFESIARSIPLTILAKHKGQVHQLESLLLGQAGLLRDDFKEDYPRLLQREYNFLRNKYQLTPAHTPVRFLRMRPANFPTIRLAQLAKLTHESSHLFSKIKEADSLPELKKWFSVATSTYWDTHYKFEETGPFKKKRLGMSMVNNIIINTIVPVLFAYGSQHRENSYKLKSLRWLEETVAENNSITRGFQLLHIENNNAFDSQALIELKNEYCNRKNCLNCAIGNYVLKNPE